LQAGETAELLHQPAQPYTAGMLRWLIVVFLALVLINGLSPWLQRLGMGRLPGDFRFRLWGREWFIPLSSTLLLSFVAGLIAKWI
jgi:hypothetical protein